MSLLLLHTKVASSAAPARTATAASPHTMRAPEWTECYAQEALSYRISQLHQWYSLNIFNAHSVPLMQITRMVRLWVSSPGVPRTSVQGVWRYAVLYSLAARKGASGILRNVVVAAAMDIC